MLREDYLMRFVARLAEALARIAGLRREGDDDAAIAACDAAVEELLGWRARDLDAMDAPTVAMLLGSAEKRAAYADLLVARADALRAKGEAAAAERTQARAERVR